MKNLNFFFKKPTTVKGFFEDNYISFVMNYPYLYYLNEEGNIETDTTKPHPEIHYYGELDKPSKSYKGKWEMTIDIIESYRDGDLLELFSGNWELKKVLDFK